MPVRRIRKRRIYKRGRQPFWRRYALWIGGLSLGGIYVYFFYVFFVQPFVLRWRGIYGDAHYPAGYSIRGIDVSHHQGRVDWDKLQHAQIGNDPVSFVFIKATEGKGLLDENFKDNFYQAREHGFMRGAYHFFLPNIPAREQARHFMDAVDLEPGDLPPVLDIEIIGDVPPERLQEEALVWLQSVERHYKVKPILYTSYKFKRDYLSTPELESYPYWIAHYYVDSLNYEGKWKFWQHTDRGRLDGIKGFVDLNIYNGSMYDLRQLAIEKEAD